MNNRPRLADSVQDWRSVSDTVRQSLTELINFLFEQL